MTQTFTTAFDFTAKQTEKEQKEDLLNFAEPSKFCIEAILNYSKNLEVKQSIFVKEIEYIRS